MGAQDHARDPIHTIGHSTRVLDEFLALLHEHRIDTLVDVRRFPASRRHPHFNGANLAETLAAASIAYRHEVDLGGRRAVQPSSRNTAWKNAGFRGYADYMDAPEFRDALDRVIEMARHTRTALMCAEAVPWRCHRNLIADALVANGHQVVHILGPGQTQAHTLHAAARIGEDGRIEYGNPDSQFGLI